MPTIRWGMIGCGAVAEVKSGPGFYKSSNSALVAVTSADVAMTRSFASRHNVPAACDTTEQLLANREVDAARGNTAIFAQAVGAASGKGWQARLCRETDGDAPRNVARSSMCAKRRACACSSPSSSGNAALSQDQGMDRQWRHWRCA